MDWKAKRAHLSHIRFLLYNLKDFWGIDLRDTYVIVQWILYIRMKILVKQIIFFYYTVLSILLWGCRIKVCILNKICSIVLYLNKLSDEKIAPVDTMYVISSYEVFFFCSGSSFNTVCTSLYLANFIISSWCHEYFANLPN